jgi:predicted amidohydrolase
VRAVYYRGTKSGAVIDSLIGKIGLMICIEMAFNYGPKLIEDGAELLVTVSAWPAFAGHIYERVTKENAAKSSCWHIVANQIRSIF